jgi:CBS domain-containing membrane protein
MALATKVQDLMSTALITLRDTDSVIAADVEMKLASIRHIPVVDEKHNLIGILSARDVLTAFAKGEKAVRVGEYMNRKLVAVGPNTPIPEAIDLLLEHRFGSLPVLGADGHLIGIVTETDFLEAARAAFSAPT